MNDAGTTGSGTIGYETGVLTVVFSGCNTKMDQDMEWVVGMDTMREGGVTCESQSWKK